MKFILKAESVQDACLLYQAIPKGKMNKMEILSIKDSEMVAVVLSLDNATLEDMEVYINQVLDSHLMLKTLHLEKGRVYRTFRNEISQMGRNFELHPTFVATSKSEVEEERQQLISKGYKVLVIPALTTYLSHFWIYKTRKGKKVTNTSSKRGKH
jgi:hypothetical protein